MQADFRYTAVEKSGKLTRGIIQADSHASAVHQLRVNGLEIIELKHTRRSPTTDRRPGSIKLQRDFLSNLSGYLSANVPIRTALETLLEDEGSKELRKLYAQVFSSIEQGEALSRAMELSGRFSNRVIAIINGSDKAGQLKPAISALAIDLERTIENRAAFLNAIAYPVFLLLLCVVAVLFLAFYIAPALEPIFANSSNKPPQVIKVLFILNIWLPSVGVSLLVFMTALGALSTTQGFRSRLGSIAAQASIRVPIFGQWKRRSVAAKFLRALQISTESHLPIVDGLTNSIETVRVPSIEHNLKIAVDAVKNGKRLGLAFADTSLFDKGTISIISIGDETNTLSVACDRAATLLEKKLREESDRFFAVFSPALTIIMGLMIGLLALAVLGTMLSINDLAIT